MTLDERVLDLEKRLADLEKSDRFVFKKTLQVLDGRDVQTGRTTGTSIATAIDQKLGFWGGRAGVNVVQPTADTVNPITNTYGTSYFAGATYGNAEKNMLNIIFQALIGTHFIREI